MPILKSRDFNFNFYTKFIIKKLDRVPKGQYGQYVIYTNRSMCVGTRSVPFPPFLDCRKLSICMTAEYGAGVLFARYSRTGLRGKSPGPVETSKINHDHVV